MSNGIRRLWVNRALAGQRPCARSRSAAVAERWPEERAVAIPRRGGSLASPPSRAFRGVLINGDSLDALNFAALASIGGAFELQETESLEELELPSLARCGGDFSVANPSLGSLRLPRLSQVEGGFHIDTVGSTGLFDVSAPKLRTVGSAWELKTTALSSFDFDSLGSVNEVQMSHDNEAMGNASFQPLERLALPRLRAVKSGKISLAVCLQSYPTLEVSLPKLEALDTYLVQECVAAAEHVQMTLTAPRLRQLRQFTASTGRGVSLALPQLLYTDSLVALAYAEGDVSLDLPKLQGAGTFGAGPLASGTQLPRLSAVGNMFIADSPDVSFPSLRRVTSEL